jgi:thiol-disulfide isomerase/thioredoxin
MNNIILFIILAINLSFGGKRNSVDDMAQGLGIHFETAMTWQEVKDKAKVEGKYIFVDCYATWCGPCKEMDQKVYSNPMVGDFMNTHFVSIKIQMDTTKQDGPDIQRWYGAAHEILQVYKINGYPSLLYFSPEGKIVHRFLGAVGDSLFIALSKNALSPDKQYYTLIERYASGIRDYSKMPYMVKYAKDMGENDLANSIAKDYIYNYLDTVNVSELNTKRNLEFVTFFFSRYLRSSDRVFQFIYHNSEHVDQVVDFKGLSRSKVLDVIDREDIAPKLWKDGKPIMDNPDWSQLTNDISKKYGKDYAGRAVISAKIRWYGFRHDWHNLAICHVTEIDQFGLDTVGVNAGFFNNMIWIDFFEHCTDSVLLNRAITWMEGLIKNSPSNPEYLDTYANLLYKAGRVSDAIVWEERAVSFDSDNKSIQENLGKMKTGVPTWQADN